MLAELLLVLTLIVQSRDAEAVPAPLPFRVIVHSSNPISSVSRQQLSLIFLKRSRRWPDQAEIVPVDQPVGARLRDQFSRIVHQKSVGYVTRYWHRVIFSGRGIAPMELSTSAAVVEFVKSNRGAVGYVDLTMPLDPRVKELRVVP